MQPWWAEETSFKIKKYIYFFHDSVNSTNHMESYDSVRATSICGPKSDSGQMFCNVTAVWTVISEFMWHLYHTRSTFVIITRWQESLHRFYIVMITLWIWKKVVDAVSGETQRCWTYKYCSDSSIQAKLTGSYRKYLKTLLCVFLSFLMNLLTSVAHQLINECKKITSAVPVFTSVWQRAYILRVCMRYLLQALQVKQLSWYKLPMAWHAWLAPYTALLHFTQLPAKEQKNKPGHTYNFILYSTLSTSIKNR